MSQKETINQKIAQLDKDIEWFRGEGFSLDEAATKFKSAVNLAKDIETDLNNLENEITILAEDFS